jgi:hypothetical protein
MRATTPTPLRALALLAPLLATAACGAKGEANCTAFAEFECKLASGDVCGIPKTSNKPRSECAAEAKEWLNKDKTIPQADLDRCLELLESDECDSESWAEDYLECTLLWESCTDYSFDSGSWSDSGSWFDSGGAGGDGGGDGGSSGDFVESCDWNGIGYCLEFVNQSGVEDFCEDIGENYSIATSYAAGPCDRATEGTCSGLSGGDFGILEATGYYYSEFPSDPRDACESNGGDYER